MSNDEQMAKAKAACFVAAGLEYGSKYSELNKALNILIDALQARLENLKIDNALLVIDYNRIKAENERLLAQEKDWADMLAKSREARDKANAERDQWKERAEKAECDALLLAATQCKEPYAHENGDAGCCIENRLNSMVDALIIQRDQWKEKADTNEDIVP